MTGSSKALRRAATLVAAALVTATAGFTIGTGSAGAATLDRYVAPAPVGSDGKKDCTDPDAPCEHIQYAVDQAASGDTVHVAAGDYPETVVIAKPLTVVGAGSASTNVSGNNDNGPSFFIEPQESMIAVTLAKLSASHNHAAPGVVSFGADVTIDAALISDDADAGVVAVASTLHVTDSVVTDNLAAERIPEAAAPVPFGDGSGIVLALTAADVNRSTVSDNASAGIQAIAGNVLGLAARDLAAADAPPTTLDLTHSTVSGNHEGGVVNYGGTAIIDASTIAENVGGGVVSLNAGAGAAISNSTISGTTRFPGDRGAGDAQGGIIDLTTVANDLRLPSAERSALRTTVAKWAAGHPASVKRAARKVAAAAPAATTGTTVVGSIVADQSDLPDCFGTVTDGGYNLSSDTANSCKFSAAKHDLTKTDPKLGPLAANGGPTKTELLKKGSPAIDAIPGGAANCVADVTDQRGIDRPQPAGNACDIGAVEVEAKAIVIHPASLPHGRVGQAYHATITATGGAYPTYVFSLAPDSGPLPGGLTMDADGHITGTPTKAGTFPITVSVNDPVLKDYTIVIEAAATGGGDNGSANGSGNEPIAATGAPVMSMSAIGAGAIFAGFLLLVAAGLVGRPPARHRAKG